MHVIFFQDRRGSNRANTKTFYFSSYGQSFSHHLAYDYFLRYQVDDILWHLQCLTKQSDKAIKVLSRLSEHSVVDIFGDNVKVI
jgi:UTP:GlnB (protein PII) uridylyltransferase